MDSFNKVISFILGLVVVLVFLAVITGKLNLKNKPSLTTASGSILTPTPVQKNNGGFFGFFKPSPSPTPTPAQKPFSVMINTKENNIYKQNNQVIQYPNAKSIPSTGLPTLFIPILLSGLVGGNLLRKSGKK